MTVFQMFDFGRGSALAWGANNAPPEPIGGFKGAYFGLNASLSLTKNVFCISPAVIMFSHSGKPMGHCYHDTKLYLKHPAQSWTWLHLSRPNPIKSVCSQLTSSPIHKYLVLNRIRKLCATNYSNADF